MSNQSTAQTLNLDTIAEMATEVAFQAKAERNMDTSKVTLRDIRMEIDTELLVKGFVFENASARGNVESLIISAIKKVDSVLYDVLFPPCFMDANGRYTYDSSKWA